MQPNSNRNRPQLTCRLDREAWTAFGRAAESAGLSRAALLERLAVDHLERAGAIEAVARAERAALRTARARAQGYAQRLARVLYVEVQAMEREVRDEAEKAE